MLVMRQMSFLLLFADCVTVAVVAGCLPTALVDKGLRFLAACVDSAADIG